jgi:hypothetical protein
MKTKQELENDLALLKAQHKTVYSIEVPLDEDASEHATIYLKKYNREIYSMVNSLIAKGKDSLTAVEAFLRGCYIGGDDLEIVVNNLDALIACETPVVQIMSKYSAVLKKN